VNEPWTGSVGARGAEVYFYRVREVCSELESTLLPQEHAEADRILDSAERALFVLGRASLRKLLAARMGVHPRALEFTRTELGKLTLKAAHSVPGFNLAHAGEYVLIGITASQDVGVDVELARPVDELGLARLCFAKAEVDMLEALEDAAERQAAFFRLWTLREALLKALGRGFALEDAREITIGGSDDAPRIVCSRAAGVREQDWLLSSLRTPPGYAAALVVRRGAGACSAPLPVRPRGQTVAAVLASCEPSKK
jgi:4'-phosphopantetheinyl transferase